MHQGYLSEEAKRSFTLRAGVWGTLFFFMQFLCPFAFMVPVMLGGGAFMLSRITAYMPRRGMAFKQGALVPSEGFGFVENNRDHAVWYVTSEGATREIDGLRRPWLTRAGTNIWCFTRSTLYRYVSDTWTGEPIDVAFARVIDVCAVAGGIVVRTRDPDDVDIYWTYWDGTWRRDNSWTNRWPPRQRECRLDGTSYSFLRKDGYIYARTAGTSEWTTVGESGSGDWTWFILNKCLNVLSLSSEPGGGARLWRLADGTWERVQCEGLPRFAASVLFVPRSNRLDIITGMMPDMLSYYEFDGQRAERIARHGRGPFPGFMGGMMFLPHVANFVVPLLLAIVLTVLMRRYRDPVYASDESMAVYAPLARRALAELVDIAIAGAPVLTVLLATGLPSALFDFEQWAIGPLMVPLFMLGGMALFCGYGILTLMVFAYLEGRYCLTPGKWLLGIRVVGTDLQPCGFGRALLRNILRFVDGFFNYLVGILLVAFTEHQQRVGDFAARTIVIRKAGTALPSTD